MVIAATSVSREARWLGSRLRGLEPPLPVFRDTGRGDARHIVFTRQGGTDVDNLNGTYLVRSAWLVYISQPVEDSQRVYLEDLEEDADRLHAAIYKPEVVEAVNGRYIEECRRDFEHSLNVYDEHGGLAEIQLGGMYVLYTSLERTY